MEHETHNIIHVYVLYIVTIIVPMVYGLTKTQLMSRKIGCGDFADTEFF